MLRRRVFFGGVQVNSRFDTRAMTFLKDRVNWRHSFKWGEFLKSLFCKQVTFRRNCFLGSMVQNSMSIPYKMGCQGGLLEDIEVVVAGDERWSIYTLAKKSMTYLSVDTGYANIHTIWYQPFLLHISLILSFV